MHEVTRGHPCCPRFPAMGQRQTANTDPASQEEQHRSQCQCDCTDLRGEVPRPKNLSQTGGFGISSVSDFLSLRGSRCGLTRCWQYRRRVCLTPEPRLAPPAQEGKSLGSRTSGTKADLGQCWTRSVLPSGEIALFAH